MMHRDELKKAVTAKVLDLIDEILSMMLQEKVKEPTDAEVLYALERMVKMQIGGRSPRIKVTLVAGGVQIEGVSIPCKRNHTARTHLRNAIMAADVDATR